nr:SIR2 family protein [Variovorax sp. E3]
MMTEDQFFDYLTMASAAKDAVPPAVRSKLSDSGLIFVGFQVEAWDFRVLFRSLLQLEGRHLRNDYMHFSVQIDPNSILDPVSARRYIEQYLQSKAKLRLYWGDVATFVAELKTQTKRN